MPKVSYDPDELEPALKCEHLDTSACGPFCHRCGICLGVNPDIQVPLCARCDDWLRYPEPDEPTLHDSPEPDLRIIRP